MAVSPIAAAPSAVLLISQCLELYPILPAGYVEVFEPFTVASNLVFPALRGMKATGGNGGLDKT